METPMQNKPLFAVAAVLAPVGRSSGKDEAANPPTPQNANVRLTPAPRAHIRIETVAAGTFGRTITAPGTVDYDNDQATTVTAPFSGSVTRMLVSLGQNVAKGQPLALVESADYAAAVGNYRKAVVTAAN